MATEKGSIIKKHLLEVCFTGYWPYPWYW